MKPIYQTPLVLTHQTSFKDPSPCHMVTPPDQCTEGALFGAVKMLGAVEILVGERLQMLSLHQLCAGRIILRQFRKSCVEEFLAQNLSRDFQLGTDFFADACLLLKKVGVRQQ